MHIPFNKPYKTGKEAEYITEAVQSGKISGNGAFTKKCQDFVERRTVALWDALANRSVRKTS